MTPQDEISVEDLLCWYVNEDQVFGEADPTFLDRVQSSTISHLRQLQKVELERNNLRHLLDQHIAALRSVAEIITDRACDGFDDIVAEAERLRGEIDKARPIISEWDLYFTDRSPNSVAAELKKCRGDAERYRWLREPQEHLSIDIEDENEDGYTGVFYTLIRHGLDEYIDAAIRAGEVKE